jgi:hypothetical protein
VLPDTSPGHHQGERLTDPISPNAPSPDELVKGNNLMDAINTLFNNLLNIGLGGARARAPQVW